MDPHCPALLAAPTLAPLPSLVPPAEVDAAFIRRSRQLRYESAHYDQQPELQRRLTKLVVEGAHPGEQTWYLVTFHCDDPAVAGRMENYRELADATTAYQRLF